MKTKPIIADLTEMVFEGRFRAYGAYHLRKLYNQRLAIATLLGLGLFFAGIISPALIPTEKRIHPGVGGSNDFMDTVLVKFLEKKEVKKERSD
jgi:hypothetical protein